MSQNRIIFLVVVFSILTVNCQKAKMDNTPERVVMKFVDFEIETPYTVYCDSFEREFKQEISVLTVNDKQFLDSLAAILAVLRPAPDSFMPDVRLVMQIYYPKKKTQKLCMSTVALELDGVAMEFEPRLLSLIQLEVKKHGKQL